MYGVDGKLLNGINLDCVKVKGGEGECFRIDSSVTGVYLVPLAFKYIYGCML